MREKSSPNTIVMINNAVSARLVRVAMERDGVALGDVSLFLLRDLSENWFAQCGEVLNYGARPRLTLLGQYRFTAFYARAARRLKARLASGAITRAYVVNNDNLLPNHVFRWTECHPGVRVNVVAEGLMNFQDIDLKNRAGWRWTVKPFLAALLGLRWRKPQGHLSGSYETATERVISFSSAGLKAPLEKIDLVEMPRARIEVPAETTTALLIQTGLWQWMSADEYERLARAFADWIRDQGFSRLIVKPHPRIPDDPLTQFLPDHETMADRQGVEDLAGHIPGATVLGTCCTALVTLKLIRPDLHCVDFGSNYYCEKAYHGDHSVETVLQAAGVTLEQMPG